MVRVDTGTVVGPDSTRTVGSTLGAGDRLGSIAHARSKTRSASHRKNRDTMPLIKCSLRLRRTSGLCLWSRSATVAPVLQTAGELPRKCTRRVLGHDEQLVHRSFERIHARLVAVRLTHLSAESISSFVCCHVSRPLPAQAPASPRDTVWPGRECKHPPEIRLRP